MSVRVGEEATKDGCFWYRVTDGEGLLNVWDTADGSYFIQVTGTNLFSLYQRFAGGGTEPTVGAGKVGDTGEALGEGGIR